MKSPLRSESERSEPRRPAAESSPRIAPEPAGAAPVGLDVDASPRQIAQRATLARLGLADPPAQLRASQTGLKTEHVEKIYKNHLKGDPPFKPQHGNFGAVSWFKGTGNPYVGGQAQNYNLTVDVELGGEPTWDDESFLSILARWDPDRTLRYDTSRHREFWAQLGASLDGWGLVEVTVPQGTLSRQGSGTFITADASARPQVTLTDPGQLSTHLGARAGEIQAEVNALDGGGTPNARAPSFSVTVHTVPQNYGTQAALSPALGNFTAITHARANAALSWGTPKFDDTLTVTYPDYLVARRSAKQFATALAGGNRPTAHVVTIVGGANWPATATRAYTARY